MNKIAQFVRESRKAAGLTQEEFAVRSGLGLRFVRELEQGKPTVRMDKVNIALHLEQALFMSKIAMLAHFLRQKMATALPMMQII